MRLAIALSGGVDSATGGALLLEAGHQVVGVTMQVWGSRPGVDGCSSPAAVEDARRVAAHLGIPFHVVDLSDRFRADVLDLCRARYRAGLTPNPCVYCNPRVKFDGMPAALAELGIEVEGLATGHYVRLRAEGERWVLRKGLDSDKDQSYFLSRLSQAQLSRAHFPLGELTKKEVRTMAAARNLPVAAKAESQDFLGGNYHALFGGEDNPGPILDRHGRRLGEHRGIHRYTVGQRRGLGVAHASRLYVTAIDPNRNAIIVGPAEQLGTRVLLAGALNWIAVENLDGPRRVAARIRYLHREQPALVEPAPDGRVRVTFDEPQSAVTPGQALVLYDGDVVLGGGLIERA